MPARCRAAPSTPPGIAWAPPAWTACSPRPRPHPDIIHATTWAIPPTSKPLAITVHDVAFLRDPDHFTAHGSAYFHRALEITRKRADAIIVPSQATADDCVEAGLDASRITVIPHGLSHTPVTADQIEDFRARWDLTRPYILWVGTREPRKNLPTLLAAYRQMEDADLDLVLVGPAGWGSDPTDAPLAPDRVHVLGRLDDADLACAYAGARVFTFPSLWEGFGLPVLEAMAHGDPRRHQRGHLHGRGHRRRRAARRADRRRTRSPPPCEPPPGTPTTDLAAAGIERARRFTWEASAAAHAAVYRRPGGCAMRTRTARVILVNWKNAPLTLRAAHSIAPQMGEGDHLVIVDNGSDDDSAQPSYDEGLEELRGAADPRARLPSSNAGTNDGFGAGVMAGAAGLTEGAVVLLNNDATVRDGLPLTPSWRPWVRPWGPRPPSSS